jgi:hypothetical protein
VNRPLTGPDVVALVPDGFLRPVGSFLEQVGLADPLLSMGSIPAFVIRPGPLTSIQSGPVLLERFSSVSYWRKSSSNRSTSTGTPHVERGANPRGQAISAKYRRDSAQVSVG